MSDKVKHKPMLVEEAVYDKVKSEAEKRQISVNAELGRKYKVKVKSRRWVRKSNET